jgi:hypothetical protein
MPIPKDYRDILETLAQATEEGRVSWHKGTGRVEVSVSGTRFAVWAGTDEETEQAFVALALLEKDGKTIDTWFLDAGDPDYDFMAHLHGDARRHAMGVPERLAAIRAALSKMDNIGDRPDAK